MANLVPTSNSKTQMPASKLEFDFNIKIVAHARGVLALVSAHARTLNPPSPYTSNNVVDVVVFRGKKRRKKLRSSSKKK